MVAGGALAAAFWPAHAQAFCRAVTVAPPAGYDPVLTGCYAPPTNTATGGGVFPLYWKNLCVGYSLQEDASPRSQITLYQATGAAAQAFAAWTEADCGGGPPSITPSSEAATACGLVEFNNGGGNAHVIAFRDNGWPYQDSSNTLGLTTLTVNTSTGEIYDADIELNSHDFTLTVGGAADAGANSYDLVGVLTHEAGHFLGLAHSDHQSAVMYAHYTPGSAPLTLDDVAGICSVYPPDGTRATRAGPLAGEACNPVPIGGFSGVCGGGDAGTSQSSLTMVCPTTSGGCSAAGAAPGGASRGEGGVAAFVVSALALLGGVARRRRRGRAGAGAVATILAALAFGGASLAGARDARASVSVAVLFDELVSSSDAAAVVTPTEQSSIWEGGRIVTYTRVQVDRAVAGRLAVGDAVWIRTMGGAVGEIGQIVEGEASFVPGKPSLVFLRGYVDPDGVNRPDHYVVAARAQGQFPLVIGEDRKARVVAADVGGLVAPSPARIARFASLHPGGGAPRFALQVLQRAVVDDVASEVAAAWGPLHRR